MLIAKVISSALWHIIPSLKIEHIENNALTQLL